MSQSGNSGKRKRGPKGKAKPLQYNKPKRGTFEDKIIKELEESIEGFVSFDSFSVYNG